MSAPQKRMMAAESAAGKRAGELSTLQANRSNSAQQAPPSPGGEFPPGTEWDFSRVAVSGVGDSLELEADRVADQVTRMPNPKSSFAPAPAQVGRKDSAREEEIESTRREPPNGAATSVNEAPLVVQKALQSHSRPLDAVSRAYFEPRFGRDFSKVRIHSGAVAEQSARDVNARAYTVGHSIVLGPGQLAPERAQGRRLLAHELTHVLQQTGIHEAPMGRDNRSAAPVPGRTSFPRITNVGRPMVSRATVKAGPATAKIDYGDLINIPASGRVTAIQSRYRAYTGVILDAALVAQISAFNARQREWVLFALSILSKNTAQAPGLDRAKAFQRVVHRAPHSTTRGLGTSSLAFEREVLTVSGWFEQAISGGLTAPSAADLAVIDPLLNPPPAASAPPGGVFDQTTFTTELPTLTRARLAASSSDPANWPGKRVQPLSQVQSVGDVIQDQARQFFSPFAETARDNRWLAGWQYSSNIASVTTDSAGNPAPVTPADRLQLLRNRARIAGANNANGPSLFSRTNFDPNRAADSKAFEAVVTALDADPAIKATLEDQFRHTGHTERRVGGPKVAISTEVSTGISECQTRWTTIRTLCHELMHSLAHPDFVAASHGSPRFPSGVTFDQVLVEGCAEVLGVQLFNHLRQKASSNAALLGQLAQGVAGSCVPPTTQATPLYGEAGKNAELIQMKVGDQRFRAAYFYGRASLMGL